MQLTVSVTVDLSATAAIDDAETAILAAGRQAMRLALSSAAQMLQAQVQSCPACASSVLHADSTAQRVVLSSFGRVVLPVLRKRCHACGFRFRAASAFLAPLVSDNITPRLGRLAAAAGSSWPYATAARWLHDTLDAQISPERVRHWTTKLGTLAGRQQQQEAEHLVAPTAADIRVERAAELAAPLTNAAPPALTMLVELDGGWIASRERAHGMEGKVSVVATGRELCGRDRHRLYPRRYAATFGSAEHLGSLTFAAASALNGTESPTQVVVGDGAEWIKTQAAWHFPDAVKILDWAHLERTVHKAIRVALPGRANKDERRRWYAEIDGALWDGRVDAALVGLERVRLAGGAERRVAVEVAMSYVRSQRGWLGDYGAWREAGYPIGSGGVEREVEIVINRRMKKQGMRWKRATGDGVVALRVETLNRTWDDAADRRRLAA